MTKSGNGKDTDDKKPATEHKPSKAYVKALKAVADMGKKPEKPKK